jgi:hypothetical protein
MDALYKPMVSYSGVVFAAQNIASNVRVFSGQLIVVDAKRRDFCLL